MDEESTRQLLDELIAGQEEKLLECAGALVPHVTADDILQPNDYPQLENHPYFRYEEGVLKGLQTARMALLARLCAHSKKF